MTGKAMGWVAAALVLTLPVGAAAVGVPGVQAMWQFPVAGTPGGGSPDDQFGCEGLGPLDAGCNGGIVVECCGLNAAVGWGTPFTGELVLTGAAPSFQFSISCNVLLGLPPGTVPGYDCAVSSQGSLFAGQAMEVTATTSSLTGVVPVAGVGPWSVSVASP